MCDLLDHPDSLFFIIAMEFWFILLSQQIVEVVLGEHDLDKDLDCNGCQLAQRIEVHPEDVLVHEDYDYQNKIDSSNDLALIKLSKDVVTKSEDKNMNVLPICLPTNEMEVMEAFELLV